jgi:hypothetical protein
METGLVNIHNEIIDETNHLPNNPYMAPIEPAIISPIYGNARRMITN